MTNHHDLCRLKLPSSSRLTSVLLYLLAYHASHLLPPTSSPSSSSHHPPPSLPSPPSFLSSPFQSWLGSGTRTAAGAGVGASPTCAMNPEQQRLTEMLNELQTVEELDPGRLALQQMWMRDNHTLSGVCPTFRPRGGRVTGRRGRGEAAPGEMPNLERQSLCPWTLEQNYRTDRFPRLLWFARCQCGQCGMERAGSVSLFSCVPLYTRVAVIREVCQNGRIHFRWGRESVPVGCVCAHPTARQVP